MSEPDHELAEVEARLRQAVEQVLDQAITTITEMLGRENGLDVLEGYYLGRTVFILTKDGLVVAAKDEVIPEERVGYYP